jgi:hypothetical protein
MSLIANGRIYVSNREWNSDTTAVNVLSCPIAQFILTRDDIGGVFWS